MGSGGGGSSGAVSHSAYLETVHGDWLNNSGVDTITSSVTDVMNTAIATSPWSGLSAYNPDVPIAAYESAMAAFAAILAGITDVSSWAALYTQAVTSLGAPAVLAIADRVVADAAVVADVANITDAEIIVDAAAFADQLDDEITIKVLPRFRRGMQDINAVVSSAFPIGEAIIEGFRDRDVAKYTSGLRLTTVNKNVDINIANMEKATQIATSNLGKNIDVAKANLSKDTLVGDLNIRMPAEYRRMYLDGTSQILQLMLQRIGWVGDYTKMSIESNRIKIVAKKEQTDQDAIIDEADAKWDLEVFAFGGNLMAAIGGGTAIPSAKSTSKAASAIGGGLSGAGAGAVIGGAMAGAAKGTTLGVPGAIVGAVLGAAMGYMSA